jgi:outer membrane protein assembly factor BamB
MFGCAWRYEMRWISIVCRSRVHTIQTMRAKCFTALFVLGWIATACFADWPQFRGPSGQGLSDAKGLPLKWSETENIKWKVAVPGRGWSSPVILGKEIWMTTANPNGTELSVVCVNLDNGKLVHEKKIFDVEAPQFSHDFNSYASPTPVIESGRLYANWGSAGTACIDTKTMKVIWERRDFKCNHYRGPGSSITVYKDLLLHHFDGSDLQYVVALDKNTGKTVWRTERSVDFKDIVNGQPDREGDWRKAYSTPRVFEFDGKPLLFSQGSKAFYGYDVMTGKELWRVEEHNTHTTSTTPISGHGLIFCCTGNTKGEVWAIRPGGSGVVNETHIVWKLSRNVSMRPSLLLVDDLIFMVDDGGIATCIEAKTGKEVWRERVGGNFSASPFYAEGRVYFFNEEGKAIVIAASRDFKVLAENQLGDGFMASAAVDGPALFLRSRTHLYRVENPAGQQN